MYTFTDKEVAELTKVTPRYTTLRPRSVSPLAYRSSFRARYGDPLYTPTYYERLIERVGMVWMRRVIKQVMTAFVLESFV